MRGDGSIWKRDHGGYQIRYFVPGRGEQRESVAKALGKPVAAVTEQDAAKLLTARLRQLRVGAWVDAASTRTTVAAVLDDYLTDLEMRRAKSIVTARSNVARLKAAFAGERATTITLTRLKRWVRDEQTAGTPAGTIARLLSVLRAAFRVARAEGRLAAVPVFPTVTVRNARQGFFERAEYETVRAHLRDPDRDIAEFAYLTGWRVGEILGLRREHVDRAAGLLRLVDSKSGEGRSLPLRDEHGRANAIGVVVERRLLGSIIVPWLFHRRGKPIPYNTLLDHWRAAAKAAGLPGRLMHDFRRTAARDLIAAGNDYGTAMAVTGHKTMAVFRRYQITDARSTARGLARLETFRATPGQFSDTGGANARQR